MLYLSKIGFSNNKKLLNSILINKFIFKNIQNVPKCNNMKLSFTFFETSDLNKSKLIIIIIDFLESLCGHKGLVNNAKILVKKGIFFKCSLNISKFYLDIFISNFNDFLLNNSLLKFSEKL